MSFRARQFFRRIIQWSFIVALALIVAVVAINWRDQSLSDEARALLAEKPVADVPDRQNIYVGLAGLHASAGSDIFEAGRKRIHLVKELSERDPLGLAWEPASEKLGQTAILIWREATPRFDCQIANNPDYLGCIQAQRSRLEATLALNAELIQRYQSLWALSRYAAPRTPLLWFNGVDALLFKNIQKVLLAQAVLNMASGNTEAGLAFFQQDMAFWRRNLEGKSYAIDSMIAVRFMRTDLGGINLVLASPSAIISDQAQVRAWRAMLTPLSEAQYSFLPAMQGEIRFMYHSNHALIGSSRASYQEAVERPIRFCRFPLGLQECSAWRWWLEQHIQPLFFKPDATFNQAVPFLNAWLELSRLPWSDYIVQRDKLLTPLVE